MSSPKDMLLPSHSRNVVRVALRRLRHERAEGVGGHTRPSLTTVALHAASRYSRTPTELGHICERDLCADRLHQRWHEILAVLGRTPYRGERLAGTGWIPLRRVAATRSFCRPRHVTCLKSSGSSSPRWLRIHADRSSLALHLLVPAKGLLRELIPM